MLDKNTKILIVGLGLMGGSYAHGLSSLGYEVGAIDINRDSIVTAASMGIISSGRHDNNPDYIGQFDVIIFALYPRTFIAWMEENGQYIKRNAIITDVTGVKSSIIYNIQDYLKKNRPDVEYIGAHPMAGKETSGVSNADKNIFLKANYIITPTEENTPNAIMVCRSIGEMLGFKTVTELSPAKHDEMIAFLSQLTHCIAVSLMTCRESEHFIDYTGDSFRDLTRIAKINDEMWSELFLLNKEMLLEQMDLFEKQFHRLREMIDKDDRDGMREMMKQSTEKRVLFDK